MRKHAEMAQRKIEIEKKFLAAPDFIPRIKQEGAIFISEKVFTDDYYDFEDYKLSLQNCWLRTRTGIWELKYYGKSLQNPGLFDSYRELEEEKGILEALADHISPTIKTLSSVSDMVKAFGLQVFASFKTTRAKYQLEGVVIDLDTASFGYKVGEIEIMVDDEKDIPEAEAKLESLAKKLGINWEETYPGKLDEYLRLHNPSLYNKLVEHGILRNHNQ